MRDREDFASSQSRDASELKKAIVDVGGVGRTPPSPEKARKAARLASSAEKKLNRLVGLALVSVNVEVAVPWDGIVLGMLP